MTFSCFSMVFHGFSSVLGLKCNDLRLDEDSSGRLSVSEVVHGIGALLKVEQNEPRVRAFLKKELNEDGQGRAGRLSGILFRVDTEIYFDFR